MLCKKKVFGLFLVLTICNAAFVPATIKVCHRNEKNFNKCIKDSLLRLQLYIRDGNFGNGIIVSGVDEIYMGENIRYDYDNVYAIVSNIKITGADQFTIEDVKASPNPFEVEIIAAYSGLKTFSDYEIRAPNFHYEGSGKLIQFITLVRQKFSFKFKKTNYGKMKVSSNEIKILDFIVGPTQFIPEKTTSNAFMEIVKDHVKEKKEQIFEGIIPISERSSKKFYRKLANDILNYFSYDDILPE